MQASLVQLRAVDLGYPQGQNMVRPPASSESVDMLRRETPLFGDAGLYHLYEVCDGVTLPDVHNGYFIHAVALIARGVASGEPRALSQPGAGSEEVLVFGSDGGGGRFAVRRNPLGEVVHLASFGEVRNGVYDGRVRTLAPSVESFLERLHADLDAFIACTEGWSFMA